MRASRFFISTLKEAPSEAELVSHRLMLRAGLIRRLAGGIYSWMPLGLRVVRKVEAIVRVFGEAASRAASPPPPKRGPYAPLPHTASTVLTGDFNMKPDDPLKHRLCQPLADGPTLRDAWLLAHPGAPHPPSFCIADQTWGQPHCCDFILISADLAPRVADVTCDGDTRLSDHQPIMLTLRSELK